MSHEKSDMYQYGLLSAITPDDLGYLRARIYWMLERWCWRRKRTPYCTYRKDGSASCESE